MTVYITNISKPNATDLTILPRVEKDIDILVRDENDSLVKVTIMVMR